MPNNEKSFIQWTSFDIHAVIIKERTQRRLAITETRQTRTYSKDEYKKYKKQKQQREVYVKKQEQKGLTVKKYKKYNNPSIFTINFNK